MKTLLRIKKHILLVLLGSVLLVSCKVDFDPNADWEETMIVYGILDQDSDTTFLRIQKCFVGTGNYIEFAKEKDSIYYKEAELEVELYSYYPWDTLGWDKAKAHRKYEFTYTESYQKPEGDFYSEISPIYYSVTKDKLSAGDPANPFVYRLEILNKTTGNMVSASTYLVADFKVTKPSGSQLGFPSVNNQAIMTAGWTTRSYNSKGKTAKVFQPSLRFYYLEEGETRHVDINYGVVHNPFSDRETDVEMTYKMHADHFLYELETQLRERGNKSRSFIYGKNMFELYIFAGSEELYEYILNNQPLNSLVERPIYTNINNGVGIFGARRQGVKKDFSSCDSRLEASIRQLNIGF